MDYDKEYLKYYNKIYSTIQHRVKIHYKEQHKKRRDFNKVQEEINKFFSDVLGSKIFINNNEDLKSLSVRFKDGRNEYFEDKINLNCKNEIEPTFDSIDKTNFPQEYNFNKFLFQIAFVEAKNEIARLLHNDRTLFFFFYSFNEFDKFEIKESFPYRLEDTETFREFHKRKYPPTEIINEEDVPKSKQLDVAKVVYLIDQLMNYSNYWEDASDSRKAEIIMHISGFSIRNITKKLNDLEKNHKSQSEKFKNDCIIIDNIIKKFANNDLGG